MGNLDGLGYRETTVVVTGASSGMGPLNAVVTGAVLYTDQGLAGGLFTGSLDASGIMPGVAQES